MAVGSEPAAAGRRLGRYQLGESLGRGGMAEVFRATDSRLGREVAIKVVLAELAAEKEFLDRFLREARLAASLDHPHILPVYDFGEEGGRPYLVMPLVAGGTLADRLSAGPLGVEQAVAWVGQLADALDAAHARGVLHRDVKPGNVLIDGHGRALLADFGIAKLYATTTRLTRTGMVVGTPTYMAPEVAAGGEAAASADRYALAVIAYELLTGRPPFEGENPLSVLHQHAQKPVPPAAERAAHLPGGVDRALTVGLAKAPGDRPATCRRFAESLALELGAEEHLGAPAAVATVPQDAGRGAGKTVPLAPPRRRRPLAWAVVAVAVVAAAIGLWVASRPSSSVPAETRPTPAANASAEGVSADRGPAARAPVDPAPVAADAADTDATDPEPADPGPADPGPADTGPADAGPAVGETARRGRSAPEIGEGAETRRQPFPRPRPDVAGRGPADGGLRGLYAVRQRPSEEDFRRGLARLESSGARLPAPMLAGLRSFAEGGLAYVEGERSRAEAELRRLVADERLARQWGPGPWLLVETASPAIEPWQLALAYGDPLREAGAELERRLAAAPADARLLLGRAIVARLDGEPAAAFEHAREAHAGSAGGASAEVRSYAALVAAEAAAEQSREQEALEWLRRAVDTGGELRAATAFQAAQLAVQLARPDVARQLRQLACEQGIEVACEPRGSAPRRRPPPGRGGGS